MSVFVSMSLYIYMCIGANALSSLAITWSRGLKLIFDFSTGISAF